jgi:hypothetical protein
VPAARPGEIGRLSREALVHAQSLRTQDARRLSTRLYLHNALPISPTWRRRLPSPAAVARRLELHPGGRNERAIARAWSRSDGGGWIRLRSRSSSRRSGSFRLKLYVSPHPERLPDALATAMRVLSGSGAHAIKVAGTVEGLLRPDKLVAYFSDAAEIHAAAETLLGELAGMRAHGVPFTAPLDPAGLISYGVDPPDDERLFRDRPISWRRWLTDRLAAALLVASSRPARSVEPWQFALHRVSLGGVDTSRWQRADVDFARARAQA